MKSVDNDLQNFLSSYLSDNNKKLEDPTVLGFKIFIAYNSPDSPFTNGQARQYLLSIDEAHRVVLLDSLIDDLKYLISNCNHYFKSISGLSSLYEYQEGEAFRGNDKVIEITTSESIDMRIAKIMNCYRKIVFDETYMRYVLPLNLRSMQLYVLVSEIRKVRTFMDGISGGIGSSFEDSNTGTMRLINDNLSMFVFQFNGCRFDHTGINSFLDSVSNEESSFISNSIRFRFDMVYESHRLGFLDSMVNISEFYNESIYDLFYTISGVNYDDISYVGETAYAATDSDKYNKINVGDKSGITNDNLKKSGLENFIDRIGETQVGSEIYSQINNADSLAYIKGVFANKEALFKRYLQPGNIISDLAYLAVDFVDNRLKRALLGQNVFGYTTGYDNSISNLYINQTNMKEYLGDDQYISSESVLDMAVYYELGRLMLYQTMQSVNGLGLISDLVIDVISQITTLGFANLDQNNYDNDELGYINSILNSIAASYDLGNIDLSNDSLIGDVTNLVSSINLVTSGGEYLLAGDVIDPDLLNTMVLEIYNIVTAYNNGDKLDESYINLVNLVKSHLTDSKVAGIIKNAKSGLDDKSKLISTDTAISKLIMSNLGNVDIINIVNDPVVYTLGTITSIDHVTNNSSRP